VDEVKPAACVPTVEHREPCESRGSRTVLGAPGGEIPPGDSTKAAFSSRPTNVRSTSKSGVKADIQEPPLGANTGLMHRNKTSAGPFPLLAKLM
jgi:hypothetical protein